MVIVEDVLQQKRPAGALITRISHYLSSTVYFRPTEIFVEKEFVDVMRKHDYKIKRYNDRYIVGCYGD